MFIVILACTNDNLPSLTVEPCATGRDVWDAIVASTDVSRATYDALETYLVAPTLGSTFVLFDEDHGDPVAVVVRVS